MAYHSFLEHASYGAELSPTCTGSAWTQEWRPSVLKLPAVARRSYGLLYRMASALNSALFNLLLDPIPALNVGIAIWLMIQGGGSHWLGIRAGWGIGGAILCGISSIASVTVIQAIGNGQFENISLFSLLWLWLACKNKWNKEAALALALVLCSSPYQGVVGLCIVLISMIEHRTAKPLAYTLPLLFAVFSYYSILDAGAHASVTPAGGHHSESASLMGLMLPTNLAEHGGVPLPGPWMRMQLLSSLPEQLLYSHRWPWVMTTATSYLGIPLLLMGLWGLYVRRSAGLAALLLLTLLLSLGSSAHIGTLQLPLPWALASWIPGASSMQATLRFLSGPTLALTIAIASTHPKIRYALLLSLFLLLDSLLVAPHHWPIRSKEPILSPVLEQLPSTPIAFWPAAPVIASHKVTTLALILKRPLILYAETNIACVRRMASNVQDHESTIWENHRRCGFYSPERDRYPASISRHSRTSSTTLFPHTKPVTICSALGTYKGKNNETAFGSLKKILAGQTPSSKIKSRPQPQDIPDWMRQNTGGADEHSEYPVEEHYNPNLCSLTLDFFFTDRQRGTRWPHTVTTPLKISLNIDGIESFYSAKERFLLSRQAAAPDPIYLGSSSLHLVQRICFNTYVQHISFNTFIDDLLSRKSELFDNIHCHSQGTPNTAGLLQIS